MSELIIAFSFRWETDVSELDHILHIDTANQFAVMESQVRAATGLETGTGPCSFT